MILFLALDGLHRLVRLSLDSMPFSLSPEEGEQTDCTCCVCLDEPHEGIIVRLGCSHAICVDCCAAAAATGHKQCPVCRVPHDLDVGSLRRKTSAFRSGYRSWRGGTPTGSKGELSDISNVDVCTRVTKNKDGHVHISAAGTLFVARTRPRLEADRSAPATPTKEDPTAKCIWSYWHVSPERQEVPGIVLPRRDIRPPFTPPFPPPCTPPCKPAHTSVLRCPASCCAAGSRCASRTRRGEWWS